MSARPAGNLPEELTSFVGRRADLAHGRQLLASSRLLTVIGVGGVGKTRLARRLASDVRRSFTDGAWLVELADLHQGALLAQSISSALGVRDESSDPVGTLSEHLRERHLLLVLDNCEHLAESCAVLIGKLLAVAAGLKIVATSRHVLGVEGEQIFPLSPLARDPTGDGLSEAMDLFEERASAADPAFRITAQDREAVAAICRQVEGLPLAVELAAANVRTFSPAEIQERLQDRGLLTAVERTRPSRHRTMEAAVEWSYQLCTPEERRWWEQLSVFTGGFTAESAGAVCSPADQHAAVAPVLLGLVDKSIIGRVAGTHGTQARYRMLEPVRQYAAERLAASAEALAVRRRHRDYFFRLAQRVVTDYCSERDVEWYATIRREQANIREALEFSLSDHDEPEIAVALADLLRPFWQQSGSILEGYRWLRRALRHATEPSRNRAAGLVSASILGFLLGEGDEARKLLRAHRELTSRHGYDDFTAVELFASAHDAFTAGDIAKAFERAERAAQAGLRQDNSAITSTTMATAAFYAFLADHERAETIATRFLNYTESHGCHLLKANALYVLGAVKWREGDVASATSLMREATQLFAMFELPGFIAMSIEGLAWSAAEADPDRAVALLGAAKSLWKYGQLRLHESAARQVGATVEARLRRRLGDREFEHALTTGRDLTFEQAVALALGSPTSTRPRSTAAATPSGLTRREKQIAALVAEGLTNKEIAARLVITQRTAESHVQNILVKLGFRSRAQIARWVSTQERSG